MDITELSSILFVELVGSGVGACLGAYLGYRYGLKQDRSMRQEEDRENKVELVNSLLTEINTNKHYLEKGIETKEVKQGVYESAFWYKLISASYQSSLNSGRFQLLKPKTQQIVSLHYAGLERMNELTSRFEYQLRYQERTQVTLADMETVLGGLKESLKDVAPLLQSEIEQ